MLIPLEVERKLEYMLNEVQQSSYTYYLKWLFDSIKLEVGTLSDSLLSDIARYIVVNVHPSNEIIFETNVLKRYVLVGNIINQIQSQSSNSGKPVVHSS